LFLKTSFNIRELKLEWSPEGLLELSETCINTSVAVYQHVVALRTYLTIGFQKFERVGAKRDTGGVEGANRITKFNRIRVEFLNAIKYGT
jgi:hypothetical protein